MNAWCSLKDHMKGLKGPQNAAVLNPLILTISNTFYCIRKPEQADRHCNLKQHKPYISNNAVTYLMLKSNMV